MSMFIYTIYALRKGTYGEEPIFILPEFYFDTHEKAERAALHHLFYTLEYDEHMAGDEFAYNAQLASLMKDFEDVSEGGPTHYLFDHRVKISNREWNVRIDVVCVERALDE